jgi:hypothetical protein
VAVEVIVKAPPFFGSGKAANSMPWHTRKSVVQIRETAKMIQKAPVLSVHCSDCDKRHDQAALLVSRGEEIRGWSVSSAHKTSPE